MNPYIDHVYIGGYSLLPNLKKIQKEPFFLKHDTFDYLEAKKKAVEKKQCFFEKNIDLKTYETICKFIKDQTGVEGSNFEEIALKIQEDIAIHKVTAREDWLAACHICFPSGWYPEEKIGKSFDQIHAPIPGMNLKNSKAVAKSMVHGGPFVRFVWGLCYERKLSTHPSFESAKFNKNDPRVWVKVERQVTCGFPEVESALFIIRQEIIEPEEINYKELYKTCCGMTIEQRKYKGISDDCLTWLSGL